MILSKAIKEYIDTRQLSEITKNKYLKALNYFCEYCSLVMPYEIRVIEISMQLIEEYICYLRDRKKYTGHTFLKSKETLSEKSIQIYCNYLMTFLNWLYVEGHISNKFNITKLIEDDYSVSCITSDDAENMFSLFNENTKIGCRNLAILHGMINQGLRYNEIINLKVDDVDFKRGVLYVQNNLIIRKIPLSDSFFHYAFKYINVFRGDSSPDNLFLSAKGDKITYNAIKGVFRRIQKFKGLSYVHSSVLRDTFILSFLKYNSNVEYLSRLVGNSENHLRRRYVNYLESGSDSLDKIYLIDFVTFSEKYLGG